MDLTAPVLVLRVVDVVDVRVERDPVRPGMLAGYLACVVRLVVALDTRGGVDCLRGSVRKAGAGQKRGSEEQG